MRRIKRQPLQIDVMYHADITPLEKIAVGDWIDLRAAESFDIKAGESCKIPLGVSMDLPKGFEAVVLPRSSMFKNYGLLPATSGLIDNTYKKQWFYVVYATRDTHIEKDERICQFRLQRNMPKVELNTVDFIEDNGRGGHGSTGTDSFEMTDKA